MSFWMTRYSETESFETAATNREGRPLEWGEQSPGNQSAGLKVQAHGCFDNQGRQRILAEPPIRALRAMHGGSRREADNLESPEKSDGMFVADGFKWMRGSDNPLDMRRWPNAREVSTIAIRLQTCGPSRRDPTKKASRPAADAPKAPAAAQAPPLTVCPRRSVVWAGFIHSG